MDQGEREAVLSLVPYFNQDYRVVVDVGSNKGEWSDLVINNVDEAHLFEPNLTLLHYTEIKFDTLRHVKYNNFALSNKIKKSKFWQYEQNYHGLSSLYYNEKWGDFPSVEVHLETIRLDSFLFDELSHWHINKIDLLKIDVEGTEWEVIQGMKSYLKKRLIKFIQIEYSEHYQVPGYKFQDIIDFVKPFGYLLYDWNGRNFFKADFKEDYIRKNYYIMQEFTEDWNYEFRKNTLGMKCNFALEIGCFEGLTTCYICDFMLNPGGRVICIDPLEEKYLTEDLDEEAETMNKDFTMFKGQYDRFIRNTKNKPVELKRDTSITVFNGPGFNEFRFDFIYIDGDHREKQIFKDACNSWEVLKEGGHILFDDYGWRDETKRGINKFLKRYGGLLTVKVKDYQVLIMKNVIV